MYIWTVQWYHGTSDIHNILTGIRGQFPFIMLPRDDGTTHGKIILWTHQTIPKLHFDKDYELTGKNTSDNPQASFDKDYRLTGKIQVMLTSLTPK